ncbi:MAG: HEAT repeat domain-containing protein [Planctomycetes bacterium]|nr:HEAT repeat domain-containing protein [Planctomycetota bacterium]
MKADCLPQTLSLFLLKWRGVLAQCGPTLLALVFCLVCFNRSVAKPPEAVAASASQELDAAVEMLKGPLTPDRYNSILDTVRRHKEQSVRVIPALMAAAPQLSPSACNQLASTIASIGDVAVEPLAAFTTHSNKNVRYVAVQALRYMKNGKQLSKHLIGVLDDPVDDIRNAAVYGLDGTSLQEAYPPLLHFFQGATESESVRVIAALALAKIDLPKTVGMMKKAVHSKDRASRRAAYLILGHSKNMDILAPIVEKQLESDPLAQRDLITGLGASRHAKAKALLEDMIDDPKSYPTLNVDLNHIQNALRYIETGEWPRPKFDFSDFAP